EVRQKVTAAYEELGTTLRRYGPLSLASLEDESELSGARYTNLEVCTSEHCTRRYHDWLKKKYKTIDTLNAEWSTSFQSFDGIKQITYKEARKLANPAQWVDWRTFMEEVWLDGLLLTRKGVKNNYPKLLMGFSNSFGEMPFSGWDFETISAHEDFSIEYPTVIFKLSPPKEEDAFEEDTVDMSTVIRQKMDIRRSFLNEKCPTPGWLWYDRSEQGAEFKPWWMAFLGTKGCTPWGPCSLGVREGAKHMDFWAFIHPLLAQTRSSTWLSSGIYDLTHGVGKIFVDYERVVSPIAVLYSQASMHMAWNWSEVEKAFYPETTSLYAWYYKSRVNITRMLRELGFTYRYVGNSQIIAGDLKNYRILFLPCSLCLPEDTLKQIQLFVRNGGVVVADIGAGATDEHGKPLYQRETVQTLFGIERKEVCRKIEPAVLTIKGKGELEVPGNLRLAGMDDIIPRGEVVAEHEDGKPAIVINRIGKGKAIYLNGFLGYNLPSRLLMRNILSHAGISTPVRITSNGTEHMGYECTTFRQGDIEILGILRLREEDSLTHIILGTKKHLYDVRGKRYLGLTNIASLDLTHKAAGVLAVMPYEITGLEVSTSPATAMSGKKVKIKAKVLTTGGAPGNHVLRMEISGPSGRISRAYTDNVLAVRGKFKRTIQTALNEQPGRWRVIITDVISGKKAETSFDISTR
ncbi:MAG: beta-galactosidase, partial [Kiritimatiellae bacterium]|nr:beta-galactosidase [Kiritimatiellia bacterium]